MSSHYVYILISLKTNRFYVGETPDINARITFHNDIKKNTNSTRKEIPWELFWKLEVKNRSIARKIESHIKQMKSRKYYESLKQYPEISLKLIDRYSSE